VLSGFGPLEDSWLVKQLTGVEQTHGATVHKGGQLLENKKSRAMIRSQRVVQNDLENIPIALIAFWVAGFAATDSSQEIIWLVQVFTLARVTHTVTYYMGITGIRSLVFIVGYLSVFRALYLSW